MRRFEFDSTGNRYNAAIEELTQHQPFKRLVTYFDAENFLLTPYRDISDNYPCLVLEAYDGETFLLSKCNCGYGGHSPHHTQAVLSYLNIPEEISENYIWHNGIDIQFDQDGNVNSVKLGAVFDSREKDIKKGKIPVGTARIISNMEKRQIFFLNPQYGNMIYLFRAFELIEPKQISYYIGNNNRKYTDMVFSYREVTNQELTPSLIYGSYVTISSNEFDIVCLIDYNVAMTFVNYLYTLLTNEALFFEFNIAGITVLCAEDMEELNIQKKVKLIFGLLTGRQNDVEYYDLINLNNKERDI